VLYHTEYAFQMRSVYARVEILTLLYKPSLKWFSEWKMLRPMLLQLAAGQSAAKVHHRLLCAVRISNLWSTAAAAADFTAWLHTGSPL